MMGTDCFPVWVTLWLLSSLSSSMCLNTRPHLPLLFRPPTKQPFIPASNLYLNTHGSFRADNEKNMYSRGCDGYILYTCHHKQSICVKHLLGDFSAYFQTFKSVFSAFISGQSRRARKGHSHQHCHSSLLLGQFLPSSIISADWKH